MNVTDGSECLIPPVSAGAEGKTLSEIRIKRLAIDILEQHADALDRAKKCNNILMATHSLEEPELSGELTEHVGGIGRE